MTCCKQQANESEEAQQQTRAPIYRDVQQVVAYSSGKLKNSSLSSSYKCCCMRKKTNSRAIGIQLQYNSEFSKEWD